MQVLPDLNLFPVHWKNADSCLFKQENYIHIFKLNLEKLSIFIPSFLLILSLEEKAKSNSYSNLKDKNSCIIRRAVTRLLIAKYCRVLPEKLSFITGKNGKPQLFADKIFPSLFFNLSFSGNYALIAVSNKEIGIDLEQIKPDFNYWEVLDFVFSPEEKNSILNSSDPLSAFYRFFTRKEAIVKALGTGIHDQLAEVPVMGSTARLVDLTSSYKLLQLLSFTVSANFIGAVAFANDIHEIEFYEVNELWISAFSLSGSFR